MPDEPAVQPFVRDDPCLPCPEKDRGMNRNQGGGGEDTGGGEGEGGSSR